MKIHRFEDKSTTEAFKKVRESLGPDAVILSTKKNDYGVEVIATLDVAQKINSSPYESDKKIYSSDVSKNIEMDIKELKTIVQNQLAGLSWKDVQSENPRQAYLFKKLNELGLSSKICKILARDIDSQISNEVSPEELWNESYKYLSGIIKTTNLNWLKNGGIATFIGPSGSGKTTVVSKLCSQYSMTNNSRNICFFNFEHYKLGSREHANLFSSIFSCENKEIKLNDINQDLFKIKNKNSFCLLDSYGFSFNDERFAFEINMLKKVSQYSPLYIVLPATYQKSVLDLIISRYLSEISIEGAIITKLDEAYSLGPVLSSVIDFQIPICYVSDSQNISSDIHYLTGEMILLYAMKMANKNQRKSTEQELADSYFGSKVDIDL